MIQTVRLSRVIEGELPFTLNLPSGKYTVLEEGRPYSLELVQGWCMVPLRDGQMMLGDPFDLAPRLGDRWASSYKNELRTLARKTDVIDLSIPDLGTPTEEEIQQNLKRHLLAESSNLGLTPEQLTAKASTEYANYDAPTRKRLCEDTSIRKATDRVFDRADQQGFCAALNNLIRQYATTFEDFFVEEVLPQHFANTVFNGLRVAYLCNGQELTSFRDAGARIPFILRRPWYKHPDDKVAAFRASLSTGTAPDPVKLLGLRGKGFVIRGGYRSSIIEAWAALDLCLTRRLRDGYRRLGKTDSEIEHLLKSEIRFKQRAKKLLKEALGQSAADLDPALWNRITSQHHELRHGIAHADREPSRDEAEAAVNDCLALANKIEAIP